MERIKLRSTKKQKEQLAESYAWATYYKEYGDRIGKDQRGMIIAQCLNPEDHNGTITAMFIEHKYGVQMKKILQDRQKDRDILFRSF